MKYCCSDLKHCKSRIFLWLNKHPEILDIQIYVWTKHTVCPLLVHLMIASDSNLTGNVHTHSLVGVMVKDMDE